MLILAISVSFAFGEDFKTIGGKEYKNSTVSCIESGGIAYQSARHRVQSLWTDIDYYHSYGFYFSYLLRSPILTAETDADGKFTMQIPLAGEYVIGAQTDRLVWNDTEVYYWLQPVSLEGQQQRIVNLSNNNLYLTLTPKAEDARPGPTVLSRQGAESSA